MDGILNEIVQYENWHDLKQDFLNNTSKKLKGDAFELLTKYYLLINPIYQTKLQNVWLLSDVPLHVKEYLNLPDNDEGIDLIAQTKDDEYWAIQCKYRSDEESSITRDDIASFLDISNNVCKNISHKLVCATANRQSYKFDKLYDDKISFLLANIWNELDKEFFTQIGNFVNHKVINLKPFKPKKHQLRAIENAYKHYEEEQNSRGKLIMACGSGKSLAAYWIAEKLKVKAILIAVPSLALIKQTLEVWTRESVANKIDINWLAVCSDDTVSQLDDDIFTSSTKELGIDVSTDVEYITNWLQNKNHKKTIVFTTYQSSKVIAEASRHAKMTYDFGIMDEAHKTVGLKDSLFSYVLFDENIFIKKRLFMTATERRYKGDSDEIASMDDMELYGEDFEVLTFREALEEEPPILCDYKIIAMMVTQKEVAELIENNNFVKPKNENYTKEIEAEMLASTVALHKAIKKYGIKHTISFHSSIERARFFQTQEGVFRKSFSEYTDLYTFHVSGQTPTGKRNKVIDAFSKSQNSLITNARCLTEGVDVPNIDCVLFADPRQSTVDIVQAVGRALRLAEGKEFGYVLVPILIDDENIDIDDIQNKSFQAVISILRALASSDERIIDYFQTIDSAGSVGKGGLIDFEIPVGFNIDIEEFNKAIKLSIISKLKKLKWRPFEEAREYVRNLGFQNSSEWRLYCRKNLTDKNVKPNDIPSSPNSVYKLTGWNGMKDWLGTSSDEKYLSFEEAREFSRNLGLKTPREWNRYCVGKMKNMLPKPKNIPRSPEQVYRRDGWINYKNWLNKGLMPFEEAKEFVKKLNLNHRKEWVKYCKGEIHDLPIRPNNIPKAPDGRYREEWKGWNDWLNSDEMREFGLTKEWRNFDDAKRYVLELNLKGSLEWKKYAKGTLDGYEKRPNDIPSAPDVAYKDKGWIDYGNWLGTGRKRKGNNTEEDTTWLSYEEAREFVHSLKLKNTAEWQQYIDGELEHLPKKPEDIPNSAYFVYKDNGWIGMNDWLGNDGRTQTKVENALSFEEAREFTKTLGLKTETEWNDYKNGKYEHLEPLPNNIPKMPRNYYKNDGWIGIRDWLGVE